MPYNTEKIRDVFKSRCNLKRENQIILLMITDGKKCNYLAVKKQSARFRGIKSKYNRNFFC